MSVAYKKSLKRSEIFHWPPASGFMHANRFDSIEGILADSVWKPSPTLSLCLFVKQQTLTYMHSVWHLIVIDNNLLFISEISILLPPMLKAWLCIHKVLNNSNSRKHYLKGLYNGNLSLHFCNKVEEPKARRRTNDIETVKNWNKSLTSKWRFQWSKKISLKNTFLPHCGFHPFSFTEAFEHSQEVARQKNASRS